MRSKQDIYITSAVATIFTRPSSDHYYFDYYPTPSHAYCLSPTQGLVFTSPTQATSYPIIVRQGDSCVVDVLAPLVTHTVSSHTSGAHWFFNLSNDQTQATDFNSDFFSVRGASTQHLALMFRTADAATVWEESDVHFFPASSTGSTLANFGVRMNKTALNAVLAASSLPPVP